MVVSRQVTLSTTATRIATFPGSVLVSEPSATVYVGGADVSATNGVPVASGESVSLDMLHGDELFAVASAGTPTIQVLTTGGSHQV